MIAKQIEPPVSGEPSFSVTYSGEGTLEEVVWLVDSVEYLWRDDLLIVTCLGPGSTITRGDTDRKADLLLEGEKIDRLNEFLAAIRHLREPDNEGSESKHWFVGKTHKRRFHRAEHWITNRKTGSGIWASEVTSQKLAQWLNGQLEKTSDD